MAVDADAPGQPIDPTGDDISDQPVEQNTSADPRATDEVPTSKKSRPIARIALLAMLVVLAGLAGAGVWMFNNVSEERRADQHRQMLVDVGRQIALNLTTIDHTTVNADIERILTGSIGDFHDDFEKRAGEFVAAVAESQSKSVGTVTEAGLESQDGESADVLVAVAVQTSLAGAEEPQPRAWRMRITVTQPPGQEAKVSNVQFVP